MTGTGITRTVTVSTGTGDGTLRLNLSNTAGMSAGVSNALPFAGEAYTIDKTAPTTTSVGIPADGTYTAGQVMSYTVNYSEAVVVTGSPQLPLFIGATQRLAGYVSGSGTAALLFRYTVVSGDNDINGVNPGASLMLNSGTIRDAATNDADLRLNSVPTTTGVLVDAVAPTVTSLTGPAASGSTEGDVVIVNRLAQLGRNTVHTIQLVEEFDRRGVHFRALDLGIDSRMPAGKMIIGVFSSFNQYERENNCEKSLAGIKLAKQQGEHLGRPAGRDAEKVAKVAKALQKGLSVAEIVTLTGISRASVKRYRQELAH